MTFRAPKYPILPRQRSLDLDVHATGYFLLICWKLRLNPLCYLKQALQQEERDVSVLGEEAETA